MISNLTSVLDLERMNWEVVGEIALDSLFDSLKVLAIAFVLYFVLSFVEGKIASLLERNKKFAPLFGSVAGVIPQCGISVVASDLYTDDHITIGTLIAIFVACSDEALPILFGEAGSKWYVGFVVLGIKVVAGAIFGFAIDLFFRKQDKVVDEHLEHCEGEHEIHHGCCGHEIEEHGEESKLHEHLVHPLIHSLKITAYAFVISFLFGLLFAWLDSSFNLEAIIAGSRFFSPLIAVVIGLIPNCASSILLTELYVSGALPFGALLAGLVVNAGLGPLYLFKNKKTVKKGLMISGILLACGLILGYSLIWLAL